MSFVLARRKPAAAGLAAAALFLFAVSTTAAHEGGPRLLLEPNRINPGGVVLVRGEDLGLDEPLQLSLVGEVGRVELAAVTTDGEGHFTVAVEVPADVSAGTYAFETTLSSGAPIRSLVRDLRQPRPTRSERRTSRARTRVCPHRARSGR